MLSGTTAMGDSALRQSFISEERVPHSHGDVSQRRSRYGTKRASGAVKLC
eukprot:COSAG03_NODE_11478_length_590_cov_1.250509_1_plen_49_part_10